MNNKTDVKVEYLSPLKRICMTIGELPSSYLETMSYYEMLVWFTEFLKNNVIPTINNNAEAVQEIQALYEELRIYVNDYFDNLDVQEEINNKLDEMLDDGVLEQIIEQFLQLTSLICFDNVSSMKASTNLANGSFAKTLGYHTKGDNGEALYKIRTITNQDVVNETTIISLHDINLIAELIVKDNTVTPEMFGAYGDGTHDDTTAIENAIKFTTKPHVVQFASKTYAITNIEIDYENGNVILKGVNSHYRHFNFNEATKIVPYTGMTGTMFTIGETGVGFDSMVFGFTVKDICFTGNSIDGYDYNCFEFGRSSNLLFENVIFRRINGVAVHLKGVYDSIFNNVEFMANGDYTDTTGNYSLIIEGALTENTTTTSSNAIRFNDCRFEGNSKDIFFKEYYNQLFFNGCKFEEICSASKVMIQSFGEINFTNCVFTSSGTDYLIAFNNTQNRCLTKFLNCTFTAPTAGLSGGKWINVIASNANGIIIDGCSFQNPHFNSSLALGNYTKLLNSTFYSYSSDAITKVVEANYFCEIRNITVIFANNTKPATGSFILLNNTGNVVKDIISTNLATMDYTCLYKASSPDNELDHYNKKIVAGGTSVDARNSNAFNLNSSTTVNEITNSWNGCEITFYSGGASVVLDFTGIPLIYNYITSLTISPGRTATLKKVNNTQWVLISSNT